MTLFPYTTLFRSNLLLPNLLQRPATNYFGCEINLLQPNIWLPEVDFGVVQPPSVNDEDEGEIEID